jgi:hypothetical protein
LKMKKETHPLPRPLGRRSSSGLIAALLIAAAALLLSACGSSSSSGTGTSSVKTTAAVGSPTGRFASLRECLKKQGIELPAPSGKPGSGGPPSGGAGGFKPPSGTSGTKLQEAIKKCGGSGFPGGGRGSLNSTSAKAALTKYASCMRESGIDLPAPNTSGKGPVFNTKGLNTSSQAFKSAQKTCQSDLKGAFGAGAPPSGGAPPGGAEGPPGGAEGPPGGESGPPPGAEVPQG